MLALMWVMAASEPLACQYDIDCAEAIGWELQARATVFINFRHSAYPATSTGVLIHDPAKPGRPLLVTAAHNVDRNLDDELDEFDQANLAANVQFTFHVVNESPECPGLTPVFENPVALAEVYPAVLGTDGLGAKIIAWHK